MQKKRTHLSKKRAKMCKIVQKRAKLCQNVQKRGSQIFLDPIQKRAPARSVQLEAVYLEALLQIRKTLVKPEYS